MSRRDKMAWRCERQVRMAYDWSIGAKEYSGMYRTGLNMSCRAACCLGIVQRYTSSSYLPRAQPPKYTVPKRFAKQNF